LVRTGTARRASRQIEEDCGGFGADLSTSAGQDTSAIAFAGLSEFAAPLLGLVNELAREASFPDAELERERRQKLEEVKLERTQPGFLAGERLRKVLFGEHPYAKISPSEAQVAAYKKRRTANDLSRILHAGKCNATPRRRFRAEAMLGTIEKSLRRGPEKSQRCRRLPVPQIARTPRVSRACPGAVQTQILCGCHSITRKNPDWIKLGLTTVFTAAHSIRGS